MTTIASAQELDRAAVELAERRGLAITEAYLELARSWSASQEELVPAPVQVSVQD